MILSEVSTRIGRPVVNFQSSDDSSDLELESAPAKLLTVVAMITSEEMPSCLILPLDAIWSAFRYALHLTACLGGGRIAINVR